MSCNKDVFPISTESLTPVLVLMLTGLLIFYKSSISEEQGGFDLNQISVNHYLNH